MQKNLIIYGAIILIASGISGCVTTQDSGRTAQIQEDIFLLKEEITRNRGRLESLEMENQRLTREIGALQSERTGGQVQETQSRLDSVERRIQALDAARANDRQMIVEQISATMAKMIGNTAGREASRSPGAGNATGYEHIVKEGETLSAIAAAYKTKPETIIEANKLKNPNLLVKGQKLFIPRP